MSEIKFITEQDETGLGRIVVDGRYFGLPAREVAIFAAANERIRELEADCIRLKSAWDSAYRQAMENGEAFAAERAISDKLEKALTRAEDSLGRFCGDEGWGQADMDNWDISIATLAEVAAMRKGEKP